MNKIIEWCNKPLMKAIMPPWTGMLFMVVLGNVLNNTGTRWLSVPMLVVFALVLFSEVYFAREEQRLLEMWKGLATGHLRRTIYPVVAAGHLYKVTANGEPINAFVTQEDLERWHEQGVEVEITRVVSDQDMEEIERYLAEESS